MGLRIRTNMSSLHAQRQMAETSEETQLSMAKLASGRRITRAADDAAGLAISEKMGARVRSQHQARRNAGDSISLLQIAEGGMAEVNNMLVRLRELAVQSASDTIGNKERSFANREYVALVDEIDRISKTTRFNDINLLAGEAGNDGKELFTFHIGAGDGSVENTDTISLNIESIKLDAENELGLSNDAEIGPMRADDDFERQTAATKLTVIDGAIESVSSKRAHLGALQNRMNSTVRNLGVAIENTDAAKSRILDTDFAAETANLTQRKILGQAGVSVLSHANTQPEIALALLR